MTEAEQSVNAFCSALLGGPDGTGDDRLTGFSICLWSLPDKLTRWFPAEVPEAIASAVSELASRQPSAVHAVYCGMGLVPNEVAEEKKREELRDGRKRRAEARDIVGIPALCIDIDIAGHGHAKKDLVPDLATALAILDACGVPPTLIVHTGHGVQAWWVFTEPIIFADDTERDDITKLAYAWNMTLKVRAHEIAECAAGVDSVFNLDRLMRVPGSYNTKDPDGRQGSATHVVPVTILQNNGFTYDPDDFAGFLASDEAITNATPITVSGHDLDAGLKGIDLGKIWRRVTSPASRGNAYLPSWLAHVIDADPGSPLAMTWMGERPEFSGDQSRYDAALVRILHDSGVSVERQVEALMSRRMAVGVNVDKVNPAKRVDYIARTVLNVAAAAAVADEEKATRDARIAPVRELAGKPPVVIDAPPPPTSAPAGPPTPPPVDVPPPPVPEEPGDDPEPARLVIVDRVSTPVDDEDTAVDDPWGERHPDTAAVLDVLDLLLIPGKYRDAGVRTWGLEHKDYGEAQKGRVVFRVPDGFQWPGGGPAIHRCGFPLNGAWYRREMFEVPKGFRATLERDAMITSLPVGRNKEEWLEVIGELAGHWRRDSSATDLASAAKEWLLKFLVAMPPVVDENKAADDRRSLMLDTGNWGADGAPSVLIQFTTFGEFVAARPDGRPYAGRAARQLLDYLELTPARVWMTGRDGRKRRANWFSVGAGQFATAEWGQVLEAAQDLMVGNEEGHMRMIPGGAS